MMIVNKAPQLPFGWRFGTIIREGDLSVHGWLLYGTRADPQRCADVECYLCAGSVEELTAYALRRIAAVTGAVHT